ncbi:hypothetical protein Emed_004872 [Eimeria media]
MESSCVEKTTEKLCVLLESVDEELSLLTEELLPPLRDPPTPTAATAATAAAAAAAAATAAATAAAGAAAAAGGASDPAEARQQREERRRELIELSAGVCVDLGLGLHAAINEQPPLTSSTSGTRTTATKLIYGLGTDFIRDMQGEQPA